MKCILTGR